MPLMMTCTVDEMKRFMVVLTSWSATTGVDNPGAARPGKEELCAGCDALCGSSIDGDVAELGLSGDAGVGGDCEI
jgi:hypothetical protein